MSVPAQLDSLLKEVKTAKSDTAKLRSLMLVTEFCDIPDIEKYSNQCIELADKLLQSDQWNKTDVLFAKSTAINNLGFMYHVYSDYNEAIQQYEECIEIYKEIEDTLGISRGYNNIAMVYKDAGDTEKAIEFLSQAFKVASETGDYELHNITLTNFSNIYTQQGELDKAIEYLYKAIKLQEDHDDSRGLGHTYTTLASLFHSQQDFDQALVYCEKAVEKGLEANDYDVLGSAYNNLGFVYDLMGDDSLALLNYSISLNYREEVNDLKGIAETYSNLGSYFMDLGDTTKGIEYIEESVVLREKIGNQEGLGNSYQKLAGYYLDKGDINRALDYGEKSFEIAMKIGYTEDIENSALVLSKIYMKLNRFEEAYKMHVLYLEKRDMLFNKENQKKIIEQQVDYEYAKKHLADSLNTAKTLEIAELEKTYKQEQLDKANQRNAAMLIGMLLLIAVVIMAFFAYQNKRRSEKTISLQKLKVEEQKHLLEESNKEIMDSINYAHRIQTAILPSSEHFNKLLPNSFVLYKPKDIVAGDFYWLEEVENKVIFAAADCTGHGVPGAMVSVICSNALTKSVIEEKLTDPGKLLDRTRELVIQTLSKSGDEVKDGMDISLCQLNGKKLAWAGANNPLWLIKKGSREILEIKANKQPVGVYADPKPFDTHMVDLDEGDTIYVFSDGYHDQFGGGKGKKLKTTNFKKLLTENNHLNMEEVKFKLDEFFESWRGEFEQLDDVCIIGVRV